MRTQGNHFTLVLLLRELGSVLSSFRDERLEILRCQGLAVQKSAHHIDNASLLRFPIVDLIVVKAVSLRQQLANDLAIAVLLCRILFNTKHFVRR
jgi:hypothetical protein